MDNMDRRFIPAGVSRCSTRNFLLWLAPWAALLAFLLFPVNQRLRRALRGRKGAAAILLTLAVMLVIASAPTAGSAVSCSPVLPSAAMIVSSAGRV